MNEFAIACLALAFLIAAWHIGDGLIRIARRIDHLTDAIERRGKP